MKQLRSNRLGLLCLSFLLCLGVGIGVKGAHDINVRVKATATEVTITSASTISKDDGLTVTFGKGQGTTNPTWYDAGLRLYGSNIITFSSSINKIIAVTFNWEKQGKKDFASVTANIGSYSHPTTTGEGKWTGSSNEIVFTLGTGQLQLNTFSYELEIGQTFTISFNGNGAEGTMVDVTDASSLYTLPESIFTAPSGKAFSGWKANNEGDLLAAGDKYSISADTTFYAQWANSYSVTFTAGDNGTGSYVDSNQPEGTYILPAFEDLSGISANTGYQFNNYSVNGETKNPGDEITLSNDISIDVIFGVELLKTTYDFTKNFSKYAATGWNSYSNHEGLSGKTDIGGDYEATIDLYYISKQTDKNYITTMPVFASKTASGSWTKVLQFALTETGYKIDSITITFVQWGSKTPSISLYKGIDVSGTALDTATIGTKNTLTASNFNGTTFSVGYSDGSTSSNVQSGLKSIYVEISSASTFGTVDHISIVKAPSKTVYHVGETFDSTGLSVMAYDGADEDTANFKDVTSEVEMILDDTYQFVDNDVPGIDEEVTYEGKTATFHVYVYATGVYSLVTRALNNWSGKYLIVGVDKNSDSKTVAMDSYLTSPDTSNNYETVDISDSTITAGRELEWTISKIDGGYSIQGLSGKYIGSLETKKDNGLLASDSALLNSISFNATSSEATIKGTNEYCLTFNNDSNANRFRYYNSGTVKLYRLEDSTSVKEEAITYAQLFNEGIDCDSNGINKPSGWDAVKEMWNDGTTISEEAKIILTNVDLDTETNEDIKKCIATYEYIVEKYSKIDSSTYNDFMGRNVVTFSTNVINKINTNSNSVVLVTIIISCLGIATLGGAMLLKKRKENY